MAQFHFLTKVLLLFSLIYSIFIISAFSQHHSQSHGLSASRTLLSQLEDSETQPIITSKKKNNTTKVTASPKNQTKLIKPSKTSSKNQTKLIKTPITTSKNQTKGIKSPPLDPPKNKTKPLKTTSPTSKEPLTKSSTVKSQIKKTNSTTSKLSSNSTTKLNATPAKKNSSDLHKNKAVTNKATKQQSTESVGEYKPKSLTKTQKQSKWIDLEDEDEDDLVSEFRDLPYKFHETFVPDLEKISKTSRLYLTNYNKEITKGFKPYVGNKYAPLIGSIVSFAFIIVPLILVSLVFNQITAYFSIQKVLIFIQIYLSIYFTILCVSSLITGLEPLKFFYSSSQSTYICVQVLQTLAYVLYLLLLLMYLVLVFSTETGLTTKLLGLAQTIVGFAVGLHYYITVFHRAVMRQPPKTGWKVHGVYATCFIVICLLGRMDRRKKAYFEEGGEEGKQS